MAVVRHQNLDELVLRFTQDHDNGETLLRDFILRELSKSTSSNPTAVPKGFERRPPPRALHIPSKPTSQHSPVLFDSDTYDDRSLKQVELSTPSQANDSTAASTNTERIAVHLRRDSLRLMHNAISEDSPVLSPRSPLRERTGSLESLAENQRLLDRARTKELFDKLVAKSPFSKLGADGVREAWRQLGLTRKSVKDAQNFVDKFSKLDAISSPSTHENTADKDIDPNEDTLTGLTFEQFATGMFYMEDEGHFSFRTMHASNSTHADRVENVRRKRRASVKPAVEEVEKAKQKMLKLRSPDRTLSKSTSRNDFAAHCQLTSVFRLWGPEDAWIIAFDFFVTVVLLSTIISMPLSLAFEEVSSALFIPNFLTDVVFMMDIIKNFNTGFRDEDDVLVMDRQVVRKHYLQGWFCPDLLSSVPIDAALKWSGGADGPAAPLARSTKLIKMLRLVRLAKVFRLMKASKVFGLIRTALTELEDSLKIKVSEQTVKLYRLGLVLVLVAHWMGCINYMIVRMFDFPEGSWAENLELIDAPLSVKYQWSILKAFLTLILLEPTYFTWCNPVGVGVDEGWCRLEWWVNTVYFYIGAVFYSLLISSISGILLSMNIASQAYEEKMAQVNEYMRAKKLPVELRDNIREFYAEKYKDGKMFDEASMHAEMTPALRNKILHHEMRHVLGKVPVLKDGPQTLPVRFSAFLSLEVHLEDDVVIEQGSPAEHMYFVASGEMGISIDGVAPSPSSPKGDSRYLKYIFEGCYCGEVGILLDSAKNQSAYIDKSVSVSRRTATLTVTSPTCVLYALPGVDLLKVLEAFPEVKLYMENTALGRHEKAVKMDLSLYDDPEDIKTDEYKKRAAALAELDEVATPRSRMTFLKRGSISYFPRSSSPDLVSQKTKHDPNSVLGARTQTRTPSPETKKSLVKFEIEATQTNHVGSNAI